MGLSTLKEKGQITLPASIRRQIKASKGDIFDFEVVDGKVVMTLQRVLPANSDFSSAVQENSPEYQAGNSHDQNLSKWFGAAPGAFQSPKEIDDFIRTQRDAWD